MTSKVLHFVQHFAYLKSHELNIMSDNATEKTKNKHTQNQGSKIESKRRNFSLHIPDEKKDALKKLAEASGVTLSEYVEAVLETSIKNSDVYKKVLIKQSQLPD